MHYLKRLVTVFSLGALLTMETTFNATPPANAADQDCVLHALGDVAEIDVPEVARLTGLMAGPIHDEAAITRALRTLGLGYILYATFPTRRELDDYLRAQYDGEFTDYIVGWRRIGEPVGHVMNARVVGGIIQFVDHQRQCIGSTAEPPRGAAYEYIYTAWRARRRPVMGAIDDMMSNLTMQGNRKRDETFGNFTSSCKNITLFTNVDRYNSVNLIADCPDNQGKLTPNTIDLNASIINSFGGLRWQKNGGFGASVRNCKIQVGNYTVLVCDAKDGKGSWRKAAINLDTEIVNKNGQLTVQNGF